MTVADLIKLILIAVGLIIITQMYIGLGLFLVALGLTYAAIDPADRE